MTETTSSTGVTEPGAGEFDEFDPIDDDFAPHAKQKLGRVSAALAAVLAIGLGFLGGVYIQKHHGSTTTTTTAAGNAAARRAAFAAGGGFPGAGTGAGTGGGGAAGTGGVTATGAGTGGAGSAALPAVVGTVVSAGGTTVVVKNLGGTSVIVHLSTTTSLTTKAVNGAIKAGQTVAVVGTVGADKSVSATSVTVQ